ncbi:DNase I-like protein [Gonapodya prolifera JEL478]|uniref:DNA-(apurinic or apyrimidinic site) endonuclease n=1 Tax=Gonapodya prolifera (strain JEL478) TaxID=1344416 RepID=A0A139AQ35_GONPJ|nr:DNase I-like protein [Gonapodya prolifera JEL478]|eukprot:KXS18871.1 DNase I-like protein [Gonapodya prolifera JEL478]
MTWNVNSFRTMRGYSPWTECKDYKELLDALGADIFCFQEMKVTWDKLDAEIALVPGYDAFFSISRGRGGYSGVATYIRLDRVPTPIDAEEGFTGLLSRPGAQSKLGCYGDLEEEFERDELVQLDSEGRCMITDHEAFVLFNVYFPNDHDAEREEFKLKFYRGIEIRVRALVDSGRQVIVAGDVNAVHMPIDHYNPNCGSFIGPIESHPARAWLNGFLQPRGPVVDLFRYFHPDSQGVYTCWNTKVDGRSGNFGTRIDYILPTPALIPWFEDCTIEASIRGSDHCPVVAVLRDSIETEEGEKKLLDILSPTTYDLKGNLVVREPSKLCARFYDKFLAKQQTLKAFLVNKGPNALAEMEAKPPKGLTAMETMSGGLKGISGTKMSRPLSGGTSAPPAKKAKTAPVPGQKSLLSFFRGAKEESSNTSGSPSQSGVPSGERNPVKLVSNSIRPPNPSSAPPAPMVASLQLEQDGSRSRMRESGEGNSQSSDYSFVDAESIPDMTDLADADECGTELSPQEFGASQAAAWGAIFTRPKPPQCRHGEEAKLYSVTKKGPNQGRQFWMCPRPGPTGMAKELAVNKNERDTFKCDYFMWYRDSARRKMERRINSR